jgi:hypothetical protein
MFAVFFFCFFFKTGQTGRVDPIQHIMLNGFHGSCQVTREITVSGVVGLNGSCRVPVLPA